MKPNVRAAIAAASYSAVSGQRVSSVYDYTAGQHQMISGVVTDHMAQFYDYTSSAHFSGTFPSLYHYGESCHVNLTISGTECTGYDYGSSSHFTAKINGKSISIYDYGEGKYFSYSVS